MKRNDKQVAQKLTIPKIQFRIYLLAIAAAALIGVPLASGEWAASPTQNLPLCTAKNEQHFPVLIADGHGGAIVAWSDARNANRDIFAQRVNAAGEMLWNTDGIAICELPSSQSWPLIVDDSNGGAILIWGDTRHGNQDSYAQRIDADGTKLWNAEGIPVCTHPTLQDDLNAIADGHGGVIVAWEDWRNGNQDIYAQRIDSTGTPLWKSNGVPVYSGTGDQYDPVLLADGEGGAIFAWWDISTPDWNIFAQRLSADGEPMWNSPAVAQEPSVSASATAVPVCAAMGNQGAPSVVSDEKGGAFFVWSDYRNDPNFYTTAQLYAQRITGGGTALWEKDGIPICELPVNQQQPHCIRDGTGGFIVVWWDERDIFADIYAQRVSADGKVLWDIAGVPVCTEAGVQRVPQFVSMDSGGAIAYWLDYREDFGDSTEDAIYAQRLAVSDGNSLWEANGVPVCTALKAQITPQAVSTGVGSAIVVWSDARGADYDIYIHRVPE